MASSRCSRRRSRSAASRSDGIAATLGHFPVGAGESFGAGDEGPFEFFYLVHDD
jgi:hypothetical protein